MPQHFEFVLTAYGVWGVTFALYVAWLFRRNRRVERALRRLGAGEGQDRP